MSNESYQRLIRARYSYLNNHRIASVEESFLSLEAALALPHPQRELEFVRLCTAGTGIFPAKSKTSRRASLQIG